MTMMFSCASEPKVTFKEPQPTNIKNLSGFPKSLKGQYLSVEDIKQKDYTNEQQEKQQIRVELSDTVQKQAKFLL